MSTILGRVGCPNGEPPVNCLVSPCMGYVCRYPPNLICRDNYCGGCNRDWYNRFGVKTRCFVEGNQWEQ
ncbi:hypothetical protein DPMN_012152 [Dreissena polymorpha]|uniref:Uncharacterized protein n=1 Tax=Dreissena polymorpha TaxID=45954 RepID=A0A9D4N2X2_DREPO|nr:hypothetical protein DPMN_012152 [Dreissena polymorpha]